MNLALAEKIANAVLYEGYMLYPYRPSAVKNRQRWTFGGVYPRAYSEAQRGADAWTMQTECLVQGSAATALTIKVRFLHLISREVSEVIEGADPSPIPSPEKGGAADRRGEITSPLSPPSLIGKGDGGVGPLFRPVESLRVGSKTHHTWQEAVEREIILPDITLATLVAEPQRLPVAFPALRDVEPLSEADGTVVGVLVLRQAAIEGEIEIQASQPADGLLKITAHIFNLTPWDATLGRDETVLRAFVSTHTLFSAMAGEFVSLIDPPDALRDVVATCQNTGTWPVLVGEEGERDMLLSSPIILYDYPQIAPESAGDLFDGTEIDEILTLRILTLTDAEKDEMRQADDRGRDLLERTENMPPEVFARMHGVIRNLKPVEEDA